MPEVTKPVSAWLKAGFTPTNGRKLSTAELNYDASLLQPEGSYGPSSSRRRTITSSRTITFRISMSCSTRHLSDRISGGRQFETPWSKNAQLKTTDVELMQKRLTALGLYKDKIDGKAACLRARHSAHIRRKTD
jgi:hypothetical protein